MKNRDKVFIAHCIAGFTKILLNVYVTQKMKQEQLIIKKLNR